MATLSEISGRLLTRFKEVPNVQTTDTEEWTRTAFNAHGYRDDDTVPFEDVPIVMAYAEADGAAQISLRTAWYFQYSDGDEAVDKSRVSQQYRDLAADLWDKYEREKARGKGSAFKIMKRADRR